MKDKCLETRKTLGGLVKLRRYETSEGARYTTYEVPSSVISSISRSSLNRALAKAERGRAALIRRARVKSLLKRGWKPDAISQETGISAAAVRLIRASMKTEEST